MWLELTLVSIVAALVLDAAVGYPRIIYKAVAHPVVWIGTMIDRLDRAWNRPTMPDGLRRFNGILALVAITAAAVLPAALLQYLVMHKAPMFVAAPLLAIPAATLLAQKSLDRHVAAVARALREDGLREGRAAVAQIVGRDTEALDASGVSRAAIESLAESFSDGVVAPAFWGTLAGLPGLAAYKAINTADSMIGHRSKRHRAFGWAAARLDDLVNLPAARLAALWLILAAMVTPGARPINAIRSALRDAGKHVSPNAGWPEAAMAGALGLRLGGPRRYADESVDGAWIGDGRHDADADDIRRALRLYRSACLLQILMLALAAALILRG